MCPVCKGLGKSITVGTELLLDRSKILHEGEGNHPDYRVGVTKKHGAGVYSKKFEGIARKLEYLYISKGGDELPEGRKTAYNKYSRYADCSFTEVPGTYIQINHHRGVKL